MARSTSMMPNKLGLGAILTMAFSPKVEMRIDKRQERYIGCLTGKNLEEFRKKCWCRTIFFQAIFYKCNLEFEKVNIKSMSKHWEFTWKPKEYSSSE